MIDRRAFLAVIALASGAIPCLAGERFSAAALEAANAAGKPVLVEVTAPWCPTCKVQKPILSELTKQPKFARLVVLEVDFAGQKDALAALRAHQQSTLIVFKDGREAGRSTGAASDRPAVRGAPLRRPAVCKDRDPRPAFAAGRRTRPPTGSDASRGGEDPTGRPARA